MKLRRCRRSGCRRSSCTAGLPRKISAWSTACNTTDVPRISRVEWIYQHALRSSRSSGWLVRITLSGRRHRCPLCPAARDGRGSRQHRGALLVLTTSRAPGPAHTGCVSTPPIHFSSPDVCPRFSSPDRRLRAAVNNFIGFLHPKQARAETSAWLRSPQG